MGGKKKQRVKTVYRWIDLPYTAVLLFKSLRCGSGAVCKDEDQEKLAEDV